MFASFSPWRKNNLWLRSPPHAPTPRCLAVVVLQHLKHQRLTCEKHGVSARNMGISSAYHGNGMEYLINLKGARGSPTLTYIYNGDLFTMLALNSSRKCNLGSNIFTKRPNRKFPAAQQGLGPHKLHIDTTWRIIPRHGMILQVMSRPMGMG
jgi:hypothetical protein